MTAGLSRSAAEDFLFHEADLLERWRLDEWHSLFLPDGRYEIPALDDPWGDPESSQFFVADDAELLAARITRLKSRLAHAENPPSATHRLISNVTVQDGGRDAGDGEVRVGASFIVQRSRDGQVDTFRGWYRNIVVATDDGPRFRLRRVIVASQRLRQGRLSFVL